jgi:hypothetical protein
MLECGFSKEDILIALKEINAVREKNGLVPAHFEWGLG